MTTAQDIARDDPSFVDDLKRSQSSVWMVARWLNERGYNVVVRPLRIRESVEQMAEYGDLGDLEIIQRVEVKQREVAFTGATDYPFPTVIVDVAHTWDRARPKPHAYIIVSQDKSTAAIVMGASFSQWVKVERFDAAKKRNRTFYEAPLSVVRFVRLGEAVPQGPERRLTMEEAEPKW